MTAVTVLADAILVTADTSRAMPWVRSTSAMSTVTPHTITITRHGIRLIASPSSADFVRTSTTAPANAAMPTLTLATMTLRTRAAIVATVSQCRRVNRYALSDRGGSSPPGPAAAGTAATAATGARA